MSFFKKIKKTIIIEARIDIRGILREVVKEFGVPEIVIANTIEEAWNILETHEVPPDWIITSAETNSKVNIFHLLSLIIDQPDFTNTKVSLLITEEEKEILPLAFELGTLSWHIKPFTKASIKNSLNLIEERYIAHKSNETLVAADFLREYLSSIDKFEDLIELESALLAKFPEEYELIIKLAEAQYGAKKYEEAKKTLIQAKYLDGNIKKSAEQLEEMINLDLQTTKENSNESSEQNEQKEIESFGKTFDVKTCVVIDPDESICNLLDQALKKLGISNIHIFFDGASALNWLESNPAPDAVIQEWKLPKVSGVALVQRIRQIYTNYVPIFVISSLLKKEDLSLLKEIGVSAIIEKPPQKDIFISVFTTIIRNVKQLSNASAVENLIRQALSKNDLKKVKELFDNYIKLNPEEANKKILEAEIALAEKDYQKAKELAMEAFRLKADTVFALNTLGKIMLKIGDTESAIKCFSRAQELSPKNLERLCMLSEAYSEAGNTEQAANTVKQAKSIDDKNPIVIETEAKIAISSGNISSAKEALAKLNSLISVVAYMNNRAVIAVKQGQAKEGIDLYYKALESLPKDHPKEEAILLYNLALAYLRLDKPKEAVNVLEKINLSNLEDKDFVNKISTLTKKLKNALEKGKKIQMNIDTDKFTEASLVQKGGIDIIRPMALHIKPGDMRLHLIYNCKSSCYEKFINLFKNRPKFSSHIHQTILRQKQSPR